MAIRSWSRPGWTVTGTSSKGLFSPSSTDKNMSSQPSRCPMSGSNSARWTGARPARFQSAGGRSARIRSSMTARIIPRGAIIRYREWYGAKAGGSNQGLKMTAEEVARGIVARETDDRQKREYVAYGILDPAAFAVISGPSHRRDPGPPSGEFPPRRQYPRFTRQKDGRLGPAQGQAERQPGRPAVDFLLRSLPRSHPHLADDGARSGQSRKISIRTPRTTPSTKPVMPASAGRSWRATNWSGIKTRI